MLTAESQLIGSAQEQVPVRFDGEPITVGFNSRYLLQLLEIVEVGDLRFEFREADSPVVVRPGEDERYMSLLMPMGVTAH